MFTMLSLYLVKFVRFDVILLLLLFPRTADSIVKVWWEIFFDRFMNRSFLVSIYAVKE